MAVGTERRPQSRVLIVEDDDALSTLCRAVLEGDGRFVVATVDTGTKAIETALHFLPDAIVLDWNLPGRGGAQIAADLGGEPRLRSVPVGFATGDVTSDEAAAREVSGGRPIMKKPFSGRQLVNFVNELVDGTVPDIRS